jgi:hypothetical protein
MPKRSSNKPRDVNALAKAIVSEATAEGKDPAAVSLGRRGGLKGGKARAAKLSPEKRSEIARQAAAARWRNNG